jgi:hypothetical protein
VIVTLGLANKDPMNVMEVIKSSWGNRNYVLVYTWEYLNRQDLKGVNANI